MRGKRFKKFDRAVPRILAQATKIKTELPKIVHGVILVLRPPSPPAGDGIVLLSPSKTLWKLGIYFSTRTNSICQR